MLHFIFVFGHALRFSTCRGQSAQVFPWKITKTKEKGKYDLKGSWQRKVELKAQKGNVWERACSRDIIRIEPRRIPNGPRLTKGYYSPRELGYGNEEIDLGFGLKNLIDSHSITSTRINWNCKSTVRKKTLRLNYVLSKVENHTRLVRKFGETIKGDKLIPH